MRLSTKQLWVLAYIREHPGSTLREIAEASPVSEHRSRESTERLQQFFGSDSESVRHAIEYPECSVIVRKLLDNGLVEREKTPGVPTGFPYRHFSTMPDVPEDPLERLYVAPAAKK